MENFGIYDLKIFFFSIITMEKMSQNINSYIGFTLTIIDSKIITRKFLGPANQPSTQAFNIYKFVKIIIMNKYNKFAVF